MNTLQLWALMDTILAAGFIAAHESTTAIVMMLFAAGTALLSASFND